MGYKPFKPNKGSYYSGSVQKNPRDEIKRMKLFGFRTGAAWKMIPALFYYVFAFLVIINSIVGEFREFEFTSLDVVLCVLRYIFIVIVAFSPAIFLSDFKYKKRIPLFRTETVIGYIFGLAIVNIVSVFLIWTYQYCMSDTYKNSTEIYYQEVEAQNLERIKEYESMMEMETSEVTETE